MAVFSPSLSGNCGARSREKVPVNFVLGLNPGSSDPLPNKVGFRKVVQPCDRKLRAGEEFMSINRVHALFLTLVGGLMLPAPSVQAQAAADFYKGKTLQIIVPFSAGGYYDLSTRVLARFLPDAIPGHPNVVVQNSPGGGGLTAANRLANTIEKDGLTIATFSRGVPQLAMVGDPNVAFDPTKITWLGSLSDYTQDAYLMTVNASSPIKTIVDAKTMPVHLGGVGAGSTNTTFALLARDILGAKIDLVRGFPGATDIWLSMDRGEVDGQMIDISAIMSARPTQYKEGKYRALVQFGRVKRLPSLPDVPTARELVTDANDKALLEFAEIPFFMALPFGAPPGIPADRAKILRDAFMKVAMDKTFQDELAKTGIIADPVDHTAVEAVIAKGAAMPAPVRERFGKLLTQ
jgi:tripartite-type tricarboxylate transporter receptor subunit TctC